MRIESLARAQGIRLLAILALVLVACGGQNQSERTSSPGASPSEESYNSGVAYFEHREYELAIEAFDEAILLDPTDGLAYSTKGTALIYLGRFQLAIDELDHAIRLDPQLGAAYRSRGLAYVGLGQEERGIEDYATAIGLEPRFGLAYADRAIAYARLADDTAAQRDLELAVEFGVGRTVLESALRAIRDGR